MKGKINLFLCLWAVFLLAAAVTTGCKNTSGYHTKVGMVWNTTYHITYNGPEELDDSITATLNAVGACLNVFDSTSNLSRLNRGETKQADAMLVKVLTMARNIYNATDGAFDPTLGPVIRAWGFGKGHEATADTARLEQRKRLQQAVQEFRILKPIVVRSGNHSFRIETGIAESPAFTASVACYARVQRNAINPRFQFRFSPVSSQSAIDIHAGILPEVFEVIAHRSVRPTDAGYHVAIPAHHIFITMSRNGVFLFSAGNSRHKPTEKSLEKGMPV